jgi:hypothetical protein
MVFMSFSSSSITKYPSRESSSLSCPGIAGLIFSISLFILAG